MAPQIVNTNTAALSYPRTYPALFEPQVKKKYQNACNNVKPLALLQKSPIFQKIPIKATRNRKERTILIVNAVKQAQILSFPTTWIGDNPNDLNTLFDIIMRAWRNKNEKKSNPTGFINNEPLTSITSKSFWEEAKKSTNPIVQSIISKYSEDQIRRLPADWLKIDASNMENIDRFMSKILSPYRALNSPQHMADFASIGFTVTNCEDWLAMILEARHFATIHSLSKSQGANVSQDFIRLTYELPIPLDSVSSSAVKLGLAGDDFHYPRLKYVPLTLVIQYDYDSQNNQYSKMGTPITAFLHMNPYKRRDLSALLQPCAGASSWPKQLLDPNYYQRRIIAKIAAKKLYIPTPPVHQILPLQILITQDQAAAHNRAVSAINSNKKVTRKDLSILEENSAYTARASSDFRSYGSSIITNHNNNLKKNYNVP